MAERRTPTTLLPASELAQLIAAQARDMRSNRVGSMSLDALGESIHVRPRGRVSDDRHGTENLYQRRCRCSRCRSAHAAYRQERRSAGKEL